MSAARPQLRFKTLQEIVDYAEALGAGETHTTGNWSLGQIIQHLANATNCAFDGFGFRAPWIARTFVAPFVKNSVLTRRMPVGIKLPKHADRLLPAETPVPVALDSLRRAIGRFEHETPEAEHPFFGRLASQEWELLALRHAELHLSFVSLSHAAAKSET